MKKFLAISIIALGFGGFSVLNVACGDDSSSTSNDGDGNGTTSGQNCSTEHVCINGDCHCGSDGKGKSCTDNDKCDDECRVCS